jgi:tripartite-type tricarboxylate transporter receptor subunit TctC
VGAAVSPNEVIAGRIPFMFESLAGLAGTPDHIIQKVNADLRKVVAMPDVLTRFHQLGTYTAVSRPRRPRHSSAAKRS